MGIFEKRRFKNFLLHVQEYEADNPKTWRGVEPTQPASELYSKHGLDANTIDFTGHALALYRNDK